MCESCGWEDELDRANSLLNDKGYEFASDTISGIASWIEENEHVTDGQASALSNIENSKR